MMKSKLAIIGLISVSALATAPAFADVTIKIFNNMSKYTVTTPSGTIQPNGNSQTFTAGDHSTSKIAIGRTGTPWGNSDVGAGGLGYSIDPQSKNINFNIGSGPAPDTTQTITPVLNITINGNAIPTITDSLISGFNYNNTSIHSQGNDTVTVIYSDKK